MHDPSGLRLLVVGSGNENAVLLYTFEPKRLRKFLSSGCWFQSAAKCRTSLGTNSPLIVHTEMLIKNLRKYSLWLSNIFVFSSNCCEHKEAKVAN